MVECGPFVITGKNCGSLADLGKESAFAEASLRADGFVSSGIVARLLLSLKSLEEREHALERSLARESVRARSLENRTRSLEESLSRLSRDRKGTLLATEQDYRRGCGYLFGSNGFKDGKRLGPQLGVVHERWAADIGQTNTGGGYVMALGAGLMGEWGGIFSGVCRKR